MWNEAHIDNNDLRSKSRRRGLVFDQAWGRWDSLFQEKESRDASHQQEALHGTAQGAERRRVGVPLRNSSGLAGGRNPIRVSKPFETYSRWP
jgi:hypothetical protein